MLKSHKTADISHTGTTHMSWNTAAYSDATDADSPDRTRKADATRDSTVPITHTMPFALMTCLVLSHRANTVSYTHLTLPTICSV